MMEMKVTILRIFFIGVAVALFAPAVAYASAPEFRGLQDSQSRIFVKRDFVDGPFGQVHIRKAYSGKDKFPPLILFPPTPYSGDYFKNFIAMMASDRLVIAIDTPGYGDSDKPSSLPLITEYAQSAAKVLDRLNIGDKGQKIDVLGYHTGTLIAAELAILRPDLVRKLVLPGIPYYTGEARKLAYERNAKPDIVSADGSHLGEKWDFASIALSSGLSVTRAQEHFNDMMQCHPHCWEAYHAVFSYDSEKRLKLVNQPVLIIATGSSLKEETEAAAKVFSDAELLHMPAIKFGGFDLAPGKFAAASRAFLDDTESE